MPLVWRLTRPEFADELDGEGARLFGGRWNSRGRSALYTSAHLSLSVLEVYVNFPPALRDDLPVFEAVRILIPDDAGVTRVSTGRLVELLAEPDPHAACQTAGDAWLDAGDALVLEVPSVVVPEESSFILNTAHPDMRSVAIVATRAFRFDPRLATPKP